MSKWWHYMIESKVKHLMSLLDVQLHYHHQKSNWKRHSEISRRRTQDLEHLRSPNAYRNRFPYRDYCEVQHQLQEYIRCIRRCGNRTQITVVGCGEAVGQVVPPWIIILLLSWSQIEEGNGWSWCSSFFFLFLQQWAFELLFVLLGRLCMNYINYLQCFIFVKTWIITCNRNWWRDCW